MRFLVLTLMAGSGRPICSPSSHRHIHRHLEPSAVVTGDFNNDGLLDILVTADGYDFFAGAGNGVFQVPRNTPNGGFNQTVAADFNRDGKLDLASIQTLADHRSGERLAGPGRWHVRLRRGLLRPEHRDVHRRGRLQ